MSDAVTRLLIETQGFCLGAPETDGKPLAPDEIREVTVRRLYTGDVVGTVRLDGHAASILAAQLEVGRTAGNQIADLCRLVEELRATR